MIRLRNHPQNISGTEIERWNLTTQHKALWGNKGVAGKQLVLTHQRLRKKSVKSNLLRLNNTTKTAPPPAQVAVFCLQFVWLILFIAGHGMWHNKWKKMSNKIKSRVRCGTLSLSKKKTQATNTPVDSAASTAVKSEQASDEWWLRRRDKGRLD